MNDQNQDPTTAEPEAGPPAQPAEPTEPPAEQKARWRPSRGQVLLAVGALVGVLAVASAGFAVGRTTAGDGGPDRPGHGQHFEHRGPGGGMPPAMPRDDS